MIRQKIAAGFCAAALTVGLALPASAAAVKSQTDCQAGTGLPGLGLGALFSGCDLQKGSIGDAIEALLAQYRTNLTGSGLCTPKSPQKRDSEKATPALPDEESKEDTDVSVCDVYANEVLELVNEHRADAGLPALTLDAALCEVAEAKAQDMKEDGYFDHNSPTYGTPFEMMKSFGIKYLTAGENIAMGYKTPAAVVTGWMNSEGHRQNILNENFTKMGLGHVASGNFWCQMFIG